MFNNSLFVNNRTGDTPVFVRETMGDSNKVFTAGYTEVALIAALSVPRTLTLPLANSVPAGTVIQFVDEAGGVTNSNTVAITRAGSDTINNLTTPFTVFITNAVCQFISDGTSKWTGGIISTSSNGEYRDFVPTFTGFAVDPVVTACRYVIIGKTCHFWLRATTGTSNSASCTITLPSAAFSVGVQGLTITTLDNATTSFGRLNTRVSSNIADAYPTISSTTWNAGAVNKNLNFFVTYEIL